MLQSDIDSVAGLNVPQGGEDTDDEGKDADGTLKQAGDLEEVED